MGGDQLQAEANRPRGPEQQPQSVSIPGLNYQLPLYVVLRNSNYFWEFDVLTVKPDLDYVPIVVDGVNCIPVFTEQAGAEKFITDGALREPGSWRIGSWIFGGTNVASVECDAERLIEVLEATEPAQVAMDPDVEGKRAATRIETRTLIE